MLADINIHAHPFSNAHTHAVAGGLVAAATLNDLPVFNKAACCGV